MLTVKKVTTKDVTKNVRVTQVHGSMEVKHVLVLAMKINLDKELKEQSQKEAIQKRKDSFFRCKVKCVCTSASASATCAAVKLKECSVCHNVLKSKCRKISCQGENGEKPTMLLPAAATDGPSSRRKLRIDEESDESDTESELLVESDLNDSDDNWDDEI